MTIAKRTVFIVLCVSSAFLTAEIRARDSSNYIVPTGNEILTFIPQPGLGYIVQAQRQTNAVEALEDTLSIFSAVDTQEIRGLGRQGLSVVFNDVPADENQSTVETLRTYNHIKYSAPLFSINGQIVAVIPEIVVRIVPQADFSELQSQCEMLGLTINKQMEFTEQEYLLGVHGKDAEAVFASVELLRRLWFIEWAVPNTAFQPVFFGQVIPNDEYFSKLWHLHNTGQSNGMPNADVNAPEVWEITTGDPNIIVAILDTGVDVNHPDLINNLVPGYDFFDDDAMPEPSLDEIIDGHGTNCAGLAAAQGNNDIGVTGIAWNCKIMPIRIAGGDDFATNSDIATAIRWSAENGADVLSNSWGATYSSQIIYSAVRDVTRRNGIGRDGKGCIVCCAAGNWAEGGPVTYPASYSEVIAVGAADHDNQVWYYSASGPELDITAPSGGITRKDYFLLGKAFLWTTDITGVYGYSMENLDVSVLNYTDTMGGTSGACPIVAGVAALVLSIDPNLTNIDVRRILLDSAVDLGQSGADENYGYGKVDAFAAVNMTLNLPPTPASSSITLYVDDNAPDDPGAGDPNISDPNEDGTENHPFDSIQEAIDFAIYAETILVSDGIYKDTGNYDIDFKGKAVKIHSENGPENCIIDCQNLGRGFYFYSFEIEDSILDGFTITNGEAYDGGGIKCADGSSPTLSNLIFINNFASAWGEKGGNGGGIYTDSGSSPTITDCTFIDNSAVWYGGGLFNSYGNPTLENCTFKGNKVGHYGGGFYNDAGTPTLSNCTFSYNSAEVCGGGVCNIEAAPTLTNCVFIENVAIEWDGGAFYNSYGDPIFTNCHFTNNSSGDWGGAIYSYFGSPEYLDCVFEGNKSSSCGGAFYDEWGYPKFTNCIISGNSAANLGGALFLDWSDAIITNCTFASNTAENGSTLACDSSWYSSDIQIINCILWDSLDGIYNRDNSTIAITYSNVMNQGGPWVGEGNINSDPLFADPDNSDYHLKSQAGRWDPISQNWLLDDVTSSCIDAGDPRSDFSAEPEPNGGRINMGAYGGTVKASMSSQQSSPPLPSHHGQASNPNPADGAVVDIYVTLSWTPGFDYALHNVYFGTDFSDVNQANIDNPLDVLLGQNQTIANFDPGLLDYGQTYYWRIDEVDNQGTIVIGEIWSFRTLSGAKGRACFTGQTRVWVDGKLVSFSNVTEEQIVSGIIGLNTIQEVQKHEGTFVCYDVLLESGHCITIAENHFFMTECGQWIALQNLKAESRLKTITGTIGITSVTKRLKPYVGKVYNLKVEGSDEYLVGEDAIVVRDY